LIFDSLGLGELGLIAIVAILFLDPKKLGQALRAFGKLRRKWTDIQRDVKQQIGELSLEESLRENRIDVRATKSSLRREGREALKSMTAADRAEAAVGILERLQEKAVFREAKVIAGFAGTHEEIDTEGILRQVLAAGKTLLLPYVDDQAGGTSALGMAAIGDYARDLSEGAFGILEPREELRGKVAPEPDLILIPGVAFDEHGGRLGRGKGYYDRYLLGKQGYKLGLAFDIQVLRKKLVLENHDQPLDGLITERKSWDFPQTRRDISQYKTLG
jgi:5-formyltetrahydrofolate cyclo-ligase